MQLAETAWGVRAKVATLIERHFPLGAMRKGWDKLPVLAGRPPESMIGFLASMILPRLFMSRIGRSGSKPISLGQMELFRRRWLNDKSVARRQNYLFTGIALQYSFLFDPP